MWAASEAPKTAKKSDILLPCSQQQVFVTSYRLSCMVPCQIRTLHCLPLSPSYASTGLPNANSTWWCVLAKFRQRLFFQLAFDHISSSEALISGLVPRGKDDRRLHCKGHGRAFTVSLAVYVATLFWKIFPQLILARVLFERITNIFYNGVTEYTLSCTFLCRQAFRQNVCGFDILRTTAGSFVTRLRGHSRRNLTILTHRFVMSTAGPL